MFYALLIVPHLLALIGLAVFAYRSGVAEPCDDDGPGWDDRGPEQPPPGPVPGPPSDMPALIDAGPPWRRVRVGERLSELYPPPPRREHDRKQPVRTRLKA
jgi:hypothetical protein